MKLFLGQFDFNVFGAAEVVAAGIGEGGEDNCFTCLGIVAYFDNSLLIWRFFDLVQVRFEVFNDNLIHQLRCLPYFYVIVYSPS